MNTPPAFAKLTTVLGWKATVPVIGIIIVPFQKLSASALPVSAGTVAEEVVKVPEPIIEDDKS